MKNDIFLAKKTLMLATIAVTLGTFLASVLSSGGWVMGFVIVVYGLFYSLVAIVFLREINSAKKSYFKVSKNLLTVVLISFLLIILFTPSDCGDAAGNYTFLFYLYDQLFISGANLCDDVTTIATALNLMIIPVYFFHLLMLSVLLIQINKSTDR